MGLSWGLIISHFYTEVIRGHSLAPRSVLLSTTDPPLPGSVCYFSAFKTFVPLCASFMGVICLWFVFRFLNENFSVSFQSFFVCQICVLNSSSNYGSKRQKVVETANGERINDLPCRGMSWPTLRDVVFDERILATKSKAFPSVVLWSLYIFCNLP